MTRPIPEEIDASQNGWEATWNDLVGIIADGPFPIHQHTGDQTDLASTFPPSTHDRCFAWVNHTVLGWVLYYSTGAEWRIFRNEQVYRSLQTTQTLDDNDEIVVKTGTNSITFTLPPIADREKIPLTIINDGTSGTVTIDGDGSETINGSTTININTRYQSVTLMPTATGWVIIGGGQST